MGELAVRLATLPLAPWAIVQGRRVRTGMPPMCAAAGEPRGTVEAGGVALRLLVLGESTVAGCGIATQDEALGAQTARALAALCRRTVHWHAVGRIGVTARQTARDLEAPVAGVPRADVLVVALGVNDVMRQTPAAAFARDLAAVIAMARRHHGPLPVVLAGVPPVGSFPALPQPLRALLGLRAWWLDRAAVRLAAAGPRVAHAPTRIPGGLRHLFAADGFHPSAAGDAVWGAALAAAAAPLVPA
ncbi:MAG: SGNH/GDSL hydrolase family protein [Vicinamibacteria bacterium]